MSSGFCTVGTGLQKEQARAQGQREKGVLGEEEQKEMMATWCKLESRPCEEGPMTPEASLLVSSHGQRRPGEDTHSLLSVAPNCCFLVIESRSPRSLLSVRQHER